MKVGLKGVDEKKPANNLVGIGKEAPANADQVTGRGNVLRFADALSGRNFHLNVMANEASTFHG